MIVTCDANFYRELVRDLPLCNLEKVDKVIQLLLDAEKAHGIRAMMGSIAAQELLSHLVDSPRSRAYKACLKASRVLYRHCEENNQSFRILPSPETQVSMEYFGFTNQRAINTQQTIGVIFSELAKDTSKKTIEKYITQISQTKQFIVDAENELIYEVENLCKQIDPNYTSWNLFANDKSKRIKWLNFVRSQSFKDQTAEAFLTAVFMKIQQQGCPVFTKHQIQQMIPTFISSYQAGLSLRQFFWEQFVTVGFDLTTKSRANFLWDEQILYFVGHKIGSEDIVLVTRDKQMRAAAGRCGLNNYVKSYEEYLDFLGIKEEIERMKRNKVRDFFRWVRKKLKSLFKKMSLL